MLPTIKHDRIINLRLEEVNFTTKMVQTFKNWMNENEFLKSLGLAKLTFEESNNDWEDLCIGI